MDIYPYISIYIRIYIYKLAFPAALLLFIVLATVVYLFCWFILIFRSDAETPPLS